MQTKVLPTEWYFQGGIPYSLNLHAVIFEKDVTANCKRTKDKIVDFDDLVDAPFVMKREKNVYVKYSLKSMLKKMWWKGLIGLI